MYKMFYRNFFNGNNCINTCTLICVRHSSKFLRQTYFCIYRCFYVIRTHALVVSCNIAGQQKYGCKPYQIHGIGNNLKLISYLKLQMFLSFVCFEINPTLGVF